MSEKFSAHEPEKIDSILNKNDTDSMEKNLENALIFDIM